VSRYESSGPIILTAAGKIFRRRNERKFILFWRVIKLFFSSYTYIQLSGTVGFSKSQAPLPASIRQTTFLNSLVFEAFVQEMCQGMTSEKLQN
jgi:hypothetical protein